MTASMLRSERGRFYEPWTVDAGGEISNAICNLIVDPTGSTVPIEDEERYMRRIAACVNACAGLSTELLESMGFGGLLPHLKALVAAKAGAR
jgi:hypothetical protein